MVHLRLLLAQIFHTKTVQDAVYLYVFENALWDTLHCVAQSAYGKTKMDSLFSCPFLPEMNIGKLIVE